MGIKIDERNKILNDKDMSLQLEMLLSNVFVDDFESGWEHVFEKSELGVSNSTPEQIYLETNENVTGFFKGIKFYGKNKRVLTVGSSLDQALNAILFGSRDVTVIDLNIYTKVFGELKLAAIKNLSFEEFKEFFGLNDKTNLKGFPFFEKFNLYQKISHDIPKESQIFWDSVMFDATEENIKNLFHSKFEKSSTMGNAVYYSKDAYEKIKNILKTQKINLEFVNSNYFEFDKTAKGEFDLILLSTILDYYDSDSPINEDRFSREIENDFLFKLQDIYNAKLKDGGLMQISTGFGVGDDGSYRILDKAKRLLKGSSLLKVKEGGIFDRFTTRVADAYVLQKPEQMHQQREL